jgi:CRP-like cAMP-binding protein
MAGNTAFAGNLSFLNLGELIQLLGTTGGTGTLYITSNYVSQPGVIYIDNGNPIDAANGAKTGLDALFSLFGWIDGQFEFIQEDITCQKVITQSRMEIILNGLRLLDEGQVEVLGPAAVESGTEPAVARSGSVPLIKGPLVDYSYVVDEEGFYDGDEIVQEGNHGNWIWVILEGVVDISRETPKGTLKILRIGDGAFLGSVTALLKGDNVRSATVTAVGNVQLGMLDSQLMTSELANLSLDCREFVGGLDERMKQATQMAIDIYAEDKKITDFVKGKKILIKQGQTEKRLFHVRSGQAYIARETDAGVVPIACLQKGDYFGHIPFLDLGHEPYSASVFASPDLKLSPVDPQELQREHDKLSSTLKNILTHLSTSISVTTLIACNFYKKVFAADSK